MEKSLFEQMDGTYLQEGDYLIPKLTPPEAALAGIWGRNISGNTITQYTLLCFLAANWIPT